MRKIAAICVIVFTLLLFIERIYFMIYNIVNYSDYWEGLQIFNNILDFALYSLFYIALIAFSATFLFEKK